MEYPIFLFWNSMCICRSFLPDWRLGNWTGFSYVLHGASLSHRTSSSSFLFTKEKKVVFGYSIHIKFIFTLACNGLCYSTLSK